jgi:hypothetical protein
MAAAIFRRINLYHFQGFIGAYEHHAALYMISFALFEFKFIFSIHDMRTTDLFLKQLREMKMTVIINNKNNDLFSLILLNFMPYQ